MPNRQICIDASVALKLVVKEADSARARALWRSWAEEGVRPIAPALLLFECVSTLRRLVFRDLLSERAATVGVQQLLRMPISFPAPDGLVDRTWKIARRFNRPQAYDAFYLALADVTDVPFWTADRRLFNAVHEQMPRVHLLEEFES